MDLYSAIHHVYHLCQMLGVKIKYIPNTDLSCADVPSHTIEIAEVVDLDTYLTALHELGHMVYADNPQTWDEEVQCEIRAWRFAYQQSLFEVPDSYKEQVEQNRMKGSWE